MKLGKVVLDTNVFVAAGFNKRSSSRKILDKVESGDLQLIWDEVTLQETEFIISKIPPLDWNNYSDLFTKKNKFIGRTQPEEYNLEDKDDRKFAALADATNAVLITNDDHLLSKQKQVASHVLTPSTFLKQLKNTSAE